MPNRNSGLAELAQMMQLVNGGGQDNAAAQQQHAGLQWMQMQQQRQQQEAQQELQRQHYGAMQQKQAESLQQQISSDTWRQTHAEAQDKHLLAQEKVAESRLKQQLIMERDKEQISLFQSALHANMPFEKAALLLPDRVRQNLLKQHQEEIAVGLPTAQSLVAGVYNSAEHSKLDPNAMAMIALTNAGLRPMDYMDKIDYSGMNPFPGYRSKAELAPLQDEANRPLWEKEKKRLEEVAAFVEANRKARAGQREKAKLDPNVGYPYPGGLFNPTNWGPNHGWGSILPDSTK